MRPERPYAYGRSFIKNLASHIRVLCPNARAVQKVCSLVGSRAGAGGVAAIGPHLVQEYGADFTAFSTPLQGRPMGGVQQVHGGSSGFQNAIHNVE